jgi:hypothetical protein
MGTIDSATAHAIAVQAKTNSLVKAIKRLAEDGKLSLVFDVEKYFADAIEQVLVKGNFKFRKKPGSYQLDRFYISWHVKGERADEAV